MERILKPFLNKEDIYKIRLIKKYARIRFKRFWKEWGISKDEAIEFLLCFSIFAFIFALYIVCTIL